MLLQAVCFASDDSETHLIFFADMNSEVTLKEMVISHDFFYKIDPLKNMFKNGPFLRISL